MALVSVVALASMWAIGEEQEQGRAFSCGCDEITSAEPDARWSVPRPPAGSSFLPPGAYWRQWWFPEGAELQRGADGRVVALHVERAYLGATAVAALEDDWAPEISLHADGLPRSFVLLERQRVRGLTIEPGRSVLRADGTLAVARVSGAIPGTPIRCDPLCAVRWGDGHELDVVEARTVADGPDDGRARQARERREGSFSFDGAVVSQVKFSGGVPRSLRLAGTSRVGGLVCAGGSVVWLHPGGQPELCVLARDTRRPGWWASSFTTVVLDETERWIDPPRYASSMLRGCGERSERPFVHRTCFLDRTVRYYDQYLQAGSRFSWTRMPSGNTGLELVSIDPLAVHDVDSSACWRQDHIHSENGFRIVEDTWW